MIKLRQALTMTFLICFSTLPAFAQISVTDSDVLGLLGQTQVVEIDTAGDVAINLGSAGANQTWDFSSIAVNGIQLTVLFENPAGTPFASDFPTANLVRSTSDSSGFEGADVINLFEYLAVAPAQFENLGNGVEIPELDTSFVEFYSNDVAPLPLAFNTSWTTMSADTVGDIATFATINYDTTDNTVDAWGTVTLPIGSFQCLRVRADSRYTDESYVGGQVISSFSGSSINYTWVSKDHFIIAEAEGAENDPNPNFTVAEEFSWLSATPTGISEEIRSAPQTFQLFQNYPNPFNPQTTIRYQLTDNSIVKLAVYDLTGQRITTLVSSRQSAGEYEVTWDGKDVHGETVSSGIYIYQVTVGDVVQAKKMAFIR